MDVLFQYPSSRVILPDEIPKGNVTGAGYQFQYPSSRVILPDTVCVISCLVSNYKAVCDSGHSDI